MKLFSFIKGDMSLSEKIDSYIDKYLEEESKYRKGRSEDLLDVNYVALDLVNIYFDKIAKCIKEDSSLYEKLITHKSPDIQKMICQFNVVDNRSIRCIYEVLSDEQIMHAINTVYTEIAKEITRYMYKRESIYDAIYDFAKEKSDNSYIRYLINHSNIPMALYDFILDKIKSNDPFIDTDLIVKFISLNSFSAPLFINDSRPELVSAALKEILYAVTSSDHIRLYPSLDPPMINRRLEETSFKLDCINKRIDIDYVRILGINNTECTRILLRLLVLYDDISKYINRLNSQQCIILCELLTFDKHEDIILKLVNNNNSDVSEAAMRILVKQPGLKSAFAILSKVQHQYILNKLMKEDDQ